MSNRRMSVRAIEQRLERAEHFYTMSDTTLDHDDVSFLEYRNLHNDCRALLAEVKRLRAVVRASSSEGSR